MHSCSKNIRGTSVFVLKISMVYQKKYIMADIAWIFAKLKDKERTIPVFESSNKPSTALFA